MIPILFDKDEIAFNDNGIGRLDDCISCTVTEERNGVYECDFEYPVDGANFKFLQCGRIIGVTHEESDDVQPFDIVSYSKPINGIVTFHATHISYRQSLLTVKTPNHINSLSNAFDLLRTSTPTNPFTYWTDKTSAGYLGAANGIPRTVRQILGGIEGSILDAYGGEYEFDKWNVRLWKSRGTARDFSIRYGLNMTDYNDELDVNGTYSSCIPYWTNGTDLVVGDVVNSTGSTITGRGECVPLDCSESFENAPTVAQLTTRASVLMANRTPFNPTQTIKISFARLQDLGFENLSNLYQCKLCDMVKVIFPDYNVTEQFKIVRTVWDVLSDRYDSMELGSLSVSLAQALGIDNNSGSNYNPSGTEFLPLTGGTLTGELTVNANTQTNQLNGFYIAGASGNRWGVIPAVEGGAGVMEVGRYIDFHISDTGTSDYDARLYANSGQLVSNQNTMINGSLTVENHNSAIGSQITAKLSTAKSLTANTWTNLLSVSLPPGKWLCICGVRYPSNGSGLRVANLERTSGNSSQNASFVPSGNGMNSFSFVKSVTVSGTSSVTYYLNTMSTVASSASTGGIDSNGAGYGTFIQAIRLV